MKRKKMSLGISAAIAGRLLSFLLITAFATNAASSVETFAHPSPSVILEFRYTAPEAGEVFLVWGVDGWKVLPKETRPPATFVKNSLMYTSMQLDGNDFVARLDVPVNMIVDYGFQTRRKRSGAAIEWVWEGDYDFISRQDSTIAVDAEASLADAKEVITDFNFWTDLFIVAAILFGVSFVCKRFQSRNKSSAVQLPVLSIVSTSVGLYFCLLLIRSHLNGSHFFYRQDMSNFSIRLLEIGYYDFTYVSALTALSLSAVFFFRKKKEIQRLIIIGHGLMAIISLLISFVNIKTLQMLGQPLSYQWVYYSSFLDSPDARHAIFANFSWNMLLNFFALGTLMISSIHMLHHSLPLLFKRLSQRYFFVIGMIAVILCLAISHWFVQASALAKPKLVNPVAFFLESLVSAGKNPDLFTIQVPLQYEEHAPADGENSCKVPVSHPHNPAIQNVIIFVLESVPAKYIEAFGGSYPVTPELQRYLQHALLFTNMYHHAPTTNKTLVSMLASIYPWISYHTLTGKHPNLAVPTLSSELEQRGYRAAFLNAADNRFQNADEFLSHRRFDTIADNRSLACARQRFQVELAYSDGVDDDCLVDAFGDWQHEKPVEPFFAVLWTAGTHYPYFITGEEKSYGVNDKNLNRYLNALHHSDFVLGRLLRLLEDRGLLESTLVVVVGDHGEAFGEHQQMGHATGIYEENVRIPLVLINPVLFKGDKNDTIGGMVDLAPTIFCLLNFPAPADWQGKSLFAKNQPSRTYFFSPWYDFLFGLRDGNHKYIFNATANLHEFYDLNADPMETKNLADEMPEAVQHANLRLASWVQYHDRYMKNLIQKKN